MKHMKVMKIKPSMLFMPFVVNPLFMPRGAGCRHGNLTFIFQPHAETRSREEIACRAIVWSPAFRRNLAPAA